MSSAVAWLETHIAEAPAQLRERMQRALANADETKPVAQQLSDAAMSCLSASLSNTGERSCAIDLLAADALLTHACQAAAEEGAESLVTLTESMNADSFAALLREQ